MIFVFDLGLHVTEMLEDKTLHIEDFVRFREEALHAYFFHLVLALHCDVGGDGYNFGLKVVAGDHLDDVL